MNDLVEFLTSTETMVVYIVVGVACLLCLIVYLLDKSYYKRKRRHNTRELNKVVEKVQEEIKEETTEVLEPTMTKVEEPKLVVEEEVKEEPNLEYTNIEPDKTEAQEELQRLTEVLEQAQEEEEKSINLTEFEEEQEKNAIISIEELMSKTKAMYESGEFDKYEDEKVNPISLDDLEKKKEEEPVLVTLDDIETAKASEEVVSTFKSSPIISPVFGIETNIGTKATEMELENTANYEKLDEEIKKTNEFLTTLKELQKNLD